MARKQVLLDADGLWNYALRLVAGRAMSIGELRKKLAAKAVSEADVDPVLGKLKEMRVLNDRVYADSYATARRDGSLMGKGRVLRELAQKQVPRIVAETAVKEAYQEVDEVSHALEFLKRRVRNADFSDRKTVQSAYRKLRYNGFSSPAAVAALKRLSSVEGVDDLTDESED